jgi:hypothetical protein
LSFEIDGTTKFLNVDLDLYSRSSLKPLVDALRHRVIVLFEGRERRRYSTHLELNASPKSADAAIRGFAALVNAMPRSMRVLWNASTTRDFNIGIQAAAAPHACEIKVAAQTIQMVAALKAGIIVTVYAAEMPTSAKQKVSRRRQ